jgi:predicted SAM-dependent methyltransferase
MTVPTSDARASLRYLQYGCGLSAPSGWLNYDASPTLRLERLPLVGRFVKINQQRFPPSVMFGDVTRGLPLPDRSCIGIYASHVLEHLSYVDFHKALDETFRLLHEGGIFRAVVPDLRTLAADYLDKVSGGDPSAGIDFVRASHLGREHRPRGMIGWARAFMGNSYHLWMWDYPGLSEALRHHGFVRIRRAAFNDCEDPAFRAVEDERRFTAACAVEARKP